MTKWLAPFFPCRYFTCPRLLIPSFPLLSVLPHPSPTPLPPNPLPPTPLPPTPTSTHSHFSSLLFLPPPPRSLLEFVASIPDLGSNVWQGGIAQFSGTKFSLAHIAPATRDLVGGFAVALLAGGKTYLPNIHSRAKLGDVRGITVLRRYGVTVLWCYVVGRERREQRQRRREIQL